MRLSEIFKTPPGAGLNLGDMNTAFQVECAIDVAAPAPVLYAIYQDVPAWPSWDPDTAAAELMGPWALGTWGRLKPRKGMSVRLQLTAFEPDRSFTVQCPVLGSRMVFEHLLQTLPSGLTRVIHRVSFVGWLAWPLHATVGRDVRLGLPVTLQGLKQLAEGVATIPT